MGVLGSIPGRRDNWDIYTNLMLLLSSAYNSETFDVIRLHTIKYGHTFHRGGVLLIIVICYNHEVPEPSLLKESHQAYR